MGNTAQMKNGPSLIIHQPSGVDGDVTSSSFFRLGSYRDSDAATSEARLVTHLSTTTSSQQLPTDPSRNDDPLAAPAAAQMPMTAIPVPSDDSGILLYSNGDLQENIAGAARSKYGKGHIIEVIENDSYHKVANGTHNIYARNGINISSGIPHGKNSEEISSDIIITATGHIQQICRKDNIVVTNGQKIEQVKGNHWFTNYDLKGSLVLGQNLNLYIGNNTSVSVGLTESIAINAELSLRASARLQLVLGADRIFNFSGNFSVITGGKTETVYGNNKSKLYGLDTKETIGGEIKSVTGDSLSTVNGKSTSFIDEGLKVAKIKNTKFVVGADQKKVAISGANTTDFKWEVSRKKYSEADSESHANKLSQIFSHQICSVHKNQLVNAKISTFL